MNEKNRSSNILNQLKRTDEAQVWEGLQRELQSFEGKLVVLDDDPTGVQTVHDIYVYTDWKVDSLVSGLLSPERLFFILTNSRGLTASETEKIHREIAENLVAASAQTGVAFTLISRSDSTLRGHFPLETETLKNVLEEHELSIDGEILCPYFKEGGRFTIDDIHYVQYGDELVPAAETEFAKDKTFGYSHSDLKEYIEEKTKGQYAADSVVSISLSELRERDYDGIAEKLAGVRDFGKIIVNAVEPADVETFSTALYRAMKQGRHFMFRTAAGLVKALGGIDSRPLLTREDMIRSDSTNGGLVVVGSHTQKTTEQLAELLKLENTEAVAFNSDLVQEGENAFAKEIQRCIREEERIIRDGKLAVCYTSRKLLTLENDTPESALLRSVKISDGVQRLVRDLKETPAFIIAKGGITSSTIGTEALGVTRALVLGQIVPGVPVWQTDPGSRFPGIPYIIFPGNVGNRESLKEAAKRLLE